MTSNVVAAALLGAALWACSGPRAAEWHQEADHRWRDLEVRRGEARFTRMNRIDFQNEVSDSLLLKNRVLGQGAGVALGDVDGDGRVDVFLARTEGCSALYRNTGNWRFEDVTTIAGVGVCDRHASAVAMADLDSDTDLDLILLATTGPNAVFVNDGRGVFTERRDLGLDTTGRGGSAITMADIDGDGPLELFIANYRAWNIDDSIPPQRRAFNQMVRQTGPNRYEIVPEHRDNYRLVMRPDMGGLRITTRASPNELYRVRDGRFAKIPMSEGRFRNADGTPVTEDPESFSLGARFADLTGDGAPELYVANDFEDTDELWYNDGTGTFRRAPWTAQRQMSSSSMGLDVADVDGSGTPDIFVVDMLANDSRRLKTQMPTHTALPKRSADMQLQLQQQRNTLFLNRGDGTFSEVAQAAGVSASGWSWSTVFTDVDLDGWQDILIANGHLWDIMDADTHERLQHRMVTVNWQRIRWEFPKLPLRNVAYRNRGDLTFEDAGGRWGFGAEADISHAMALADLDDDGDQDVVVSRLGAPVLLLRNDASSPRVAVRLIGDSPNTRAVGARIRLLGGAIPRQEREVAVGGIYLSHSDYQATFAMGTASSVTLEVNWPDGRRTTIANVRPNRAYEVTPRHARAVEQVQLAAVPDVPLFEDASLALGGHRHVDRPYDDWEHQFLLVNALSSLGPGATWTDLDSDGDEDLLIGAGKGGQLAVFRNDGGRLTAAARGAAAVADFTTLLGIPGGDGGRDVLAGVSSWEGDRVTPVVSFRASRTGLGAQTAIVASMRASPGPMALADYDADGDLDLFVGGRVDPRQYPRATSSSLYRNDGGSFVQDSAVPLGNVGLVSAAVFSDLDGDGDPDLLLAREWDSLLLLVNDRGRFTVASRSTGLDGWKSRWNGVATGDLDGDGRLDIVATSWGRNTMFQADSTNPLVLLHGPFGFGGEEEMLIARHDARVGGLAPLNSYPRVRIAVPDLPDRVRTFAEYADATVEQVLGAWATRVTRKPITTLSHMAFLNRGARFEAVELATEAQLAPAFYAGIADFDGDGAEDVFLSQNFYPTATGLPRYDGGRALLLKGDGTGRLAPLPGARSGIAIYGDQRGAAYADYDADGRLDLVVTQNSAETKLLHNRGARPGLRVRLRGDATNPDVIGARLRLVYGERMGPVREVQAGSGYWSQNGAVQVLGMREQPTAVWLRWPGGAEQRVTVAPGQRELVVVRQ